MIVDCHTHINCAGDDVEMSEHLTAAETVDACIVLATSDGPSEEVNKGLAEYVNKHKEKMVGFAVVEPIQDKITSQNKIGSAQSATHLPLPTSTSLSNSDI